MFNFYLGFILGWFALFLLVMVPFTAPNDVWRGEAIERGYGLYCPYKGEFAWIGECKEGVTSD